MSVAAADRASAYGHAPCAALVTENSVHRELHIAAVDMHQTLGVAAKHDVELAAREQLEPRRVWRECAFPRGRERRIEQTQKWACTVKIGQRVVVVFACAATRRHGGEACVEGVNAERGRTRLPGTVVRRQEANELCKALCVDGDACFSGRCLSGGAGHLNGDQGCPRVCGSGKGADGGRGDL